MTRINSSIPVISLTDEHLLAEHREIKRLPDNLCKALKSGSIRKIPKEFCLGTGHVLFFLDKFKFTLKRYNQIYQECIKRGFDVTNYSSNWDNIEPDYFNDYVPTEKDRILLIERITVRIMESKKPHFHYYGKQVNKQEACNLLGENKS